MIRKPISASISAFTFAVLLSSAALTNSFITYAETETNTTVMENCGAYLFTWRPVDCGNGRYFAILAGGNTISEQDVILNRGYDYAYTFSPTLPRPWGEVPSLVNVDGLWGIPENSSLIPEGSQAVTRMVLVTNNGNSSTKERYVDIVSLPSGVNVSDLPAEVRKYLINVDGTDAGAYDGTLTSGWYQEDGQWRYRQTDGTYISNGWLVVDDQQYFMDPEGFMLADTVTPDGYYVNDRGERKNYIPGWTQTENGWRYLMKNGSYAAARWIQDTDGQWYYFNIGAYMETETQTPDGYYVDANGVWDGQESSLNTAVLGPGL
ncbi:hypothetical protein [Enterocloster citroniae]|uniref:Choline-binding protein n=2 Tax=Enterocloster citroniae TaxID=358743 RepID=A0ABV2FXY1_9FIRM|nr:hypothetical protein [Enterocloster citroniae]KMW13228.1 hypothetical protein HMPREF9470_00149 [[Clostridium] citroniae WAL-19142]